MTRNPEPRETKIQAIRRALRNAGYADNLSEEEMQDIARLSARVDPPALIGTLVDAIKFGRMKR